MSDFQNVDIYRYRYIVIFERPILILESLNDPSSNDNVLPYTVYTFDFNCMAIIEVGIIIYIINVWSNCVRNHYKDLKSR